MLTGVWIIVIICVSSPTACETPPLKVESFTTRQACEAALLTAMGWKPKRGAYTFNCRRVG